MGKHRSTYASSPRTVTLPATIIHDLRRRRNLLSARAGRLPGNSREGRGDCRTATATTDDIVLSAVCEAPLGVVRRLLEEVAREVNVRVVVSPVHWLLGTRDAVAVGTVLRGLRG